ncbi:hypothetical protein AV530_006318 [Patagioenas fasciata monilis]|uniref:Uncharacterized protein n=1 Tax=Patagioenas fasciata monilis TaxID=372326 RepID=A0A1V4KG24_PATFA|nr:hypothetical protein AV530_006318 [Patagioenas fasciata monilis]
MSALQESRRELMVQLEGLMKLLKEEELKQVVLWEQVHCTRQQLFTENDNFETTSRDGDFLLSLATLGKKATASGDKGQFAKLSAISFSLSSQASCSQTDNESYVRTDDEESCFRTDDEENSAANFTEEWNQEVQRLLTKKSHN